MVFGFFKRRNTPPEDIPLPPSPGLDVKSPKLKSVPSTVQVQQQLRTPSPSVEDAPAMASPVPFLSSIFGFGSRIISQSASALELDDTIQELTGQLASIPPKTLHSYIISQIPKSSSDTVAHLQAFFSDVSPPPRLHCVRCHQDYVDIENTDRSCLVAHDDESAMVERVGTSTKRGRGAGAGATFETLWGCCGKTVEGDGDQGPPDGWCYEGRHTVRILFS